MIDRNLSTYLVSVENTLMDRNIFIKKLPRVVKYCCELRFAPATNAGMPALGKYHRQSADSKQNELIFLLFEIR